MKKNADGAASKLDDVASAVLALWQLPVVLSVGWWKAGLDLARLHLPYPHRETYCDEEDQLVVPEPIENDGEHALFA